MPDSMELWVEAQRAGRYDLAWAMSARTLAARDPATRDDPSLPYHLRWVWDGRPFDGRDVLVRCYHGLGDTIMFARFLPLLAARARSVTVEAQPPLVGLLAQAPGITVVPFDPARPLPPAECDVEIMELAFALRAEPCDTPYLHAEPAALPAKTVALCHMAGDWDAARRVPEPLLAPLCARHRCLALVPGPSALPVLNPQGCSTDVRETTALLAASAAVVTVDTMVAHLAGALGRPTFLLLKADPDWRWPVSGAHTPWYPSARLYHQHAPGDWSGALSRLAADLDRFLDPR